eukprot:GHVT01045270.1.p1 GENE.GHVT01045270.1~~GHVT01045270.1.p1  ORF type:complete len:116 (+),score=17.17 GHVT01045270.1:70-417(+)
MGITTAQWRSSIGLFLPRARTRTSCKSTDDQCGCKSADNTEDELLKNNYTRKPTLNMAEGVSLQEQEKTGSNHEEGDVLQKKEKKKKRKKTSENHEQGDVLQEEEKTSKNNEQVC